MACAGRKLVRARRESRDAAGPDARAALPAHHGARARAQHPHAVRAGERLPLPLPVACRSCSDLNPHPHPHPHLRATLCRRSCARTTCATSARWWAARRPRGPTRARATSSTWTSTRSCSRTTTCSRASTCSRSASRSSTSSTHGGTRTRRCSTCRNGCAPAAARPPQHKHHVQC